MQSINEYQSSAIDVFAADDVCLARNIAESSDLGETAKDFALDLLAGGDLSSIAGKAAYNSSDKTAEWLVEKMLPKLSLEVAQTEDAWLANHLVDWTTSGSGIDWHWDDQQIADYIRTYLSDNSRLGSLIWQATQIDQSFCQSLSDTFPANFPLEDTIAELQALTARVQDLVPQAGLVKERDVYWASPGLSSFDAFGNLNPVLCGASSVVGEELKYAGSIVETEGKITEMRRDICAGWAAGGLVGKAIVSVTGAGAPPAEAVYWGGVGVCAAATEANGVLDLATSGKGLLDQIEGMITLKSDVTLARDFLQSVAGHIEASVQNPGTASTQMSLTSLTIPDLSGGLLDAFVDASASVSIQNDAGVPGLARAVLNVYRENGTTYNELVARIPNGRDLTISANSPLSESWSFTVPSGSWLGADKYYAECSLISSAGLKVRGTFFNACHATGCLFEDISSELTSGTLSAGETSEANVNVDPQAAEAEFLLGYQGSDFDLHVYDSSGLHVGMNYQTGSVETQIPGSFYSGSASYPERIRVPLAADRSFRVKVVAVQTAGPEDFFVLLNNNVLHPATLVAVPPMQEIPSYSGQTNYFGVKLAEVGGQQDATNVHLFVSDLINGSGRILSPSNTSFSLPATIILAGSNEFASFALYVPLDARGSYTGQVSIGWQTNVALMPLIVTVITTNQPPIANAGPDQTVECAGSGTIVGLDGSQSSDPDGDNLLYSWQEGGVVVGTNRVQDVALGYGTHTITLTVVDPSGASSQDTVDITVADTTPPVPNVVLLPAVSGQCSATLIAPTATDNCAGLISATTSDPTSYNSQGSFTVHWIYNDGNGNSVTQLQSVVIKDTVLPSITCPTSIVVTASNASGAVVLYPTPVASDNCAGVTVACIPPSGSLFPVGVTAVTCTATDAAGNTNSCTFTAEVRPADSDQDGIPDDKDRCPNTPTGAIVNACGCSIDQLAPCEGPRSGGTWKSHGQYVAAVVQAATDFLRAKLITRKQWVEIVTRAARSKCGWNRRCDHDWDRDWHRDWDCGRDADWGRDRDWGRD